MQISNFAFVPVLCMGLLVSAATAEELAVPDKEHRQGMSYEEYSNYREKMRKHMEGMHPEQRKQMQDFPSRPPEQMEKLHHNSAYGQGYHSRERTEDRPDTASGSRPDHPRGDRFDRGGMGRR